MANEVRLIDANALDPDLQKVVKEYKSNGAYEALCRLRSAPTIDSESLRPKGRWEPRKDAIGFVHCSVCHDCNIYGDWEDGEKWRYCPNCGAKMEG